MIDIAEIVIFTLSFALITSTKLRNYLSSHLNGVFGHVTNSTSKMRLPLGTGAEELMVTLGSLAFYITRVKNLRLYPIDHEENKHFFKTMAIGVAIGLFMDLDD